MSGSLFLAVIGLSAFCNLVTGAFNSFQQGILDEHNNLRKIYQAPPLRLNEDLCKQAQDEAERKLKGYVETGVFPPSEDGGEDRDFNDNVWASISYASSSLNAKKIVEDWSHERNIHNWTANYFDDRTGHFTQIVWRSTEDIGVGNATGRDTKKHYVTVVVVRYSPPGNILDQDTFADNVRPALSHLT